MATVAQVVENKRLNGQAVKAGPSIAELQARIAELEKQAEERKAQSQGVLTVKIMDVLSDGTPGKGGVAVFGLQRNPVTLYAEQWERMFEGCTPAPGSTVDKILKACKDPRATRKVR